MVILSQGIARAILWIIRWNEITPEDLKKQNSIKRKIAIIPHTTYFDFIFCILYMLAHPQYFNTTYVAMRGDYVNGMFGFFFRYFNSIPMTQREKSNKGKIQELTSFFQDKKEFTFLLSPEGTLKKGKWRSGYFYLAKSLECPIQVIGIDYAKKRGIILDAIYPSTLKETQEKLMSQMRRITPLYPKNSLAHCYL